MLQQLPRFGRSSRPGGRRNQARFDETRLLGSKTVQCPHCANIDGLRQMTFHIQNRAGLTINHMRCAVCDGGWRTIEVGD